jgi:hypothetical protein
MVREQVESQFPAGARFDLRRNDLVVWPEGDFETEVAYDLTADGPVLTARAMAGEAAAALPPLACEQVLFRKVDLRRDSWNRVWDATASDPELRLPHVHVLPAAAPAPEAAPEPARAAELLPAAD